MLEESSGLGAAVDAPLELLFSVLEAAVDGAGAYAEQFLFDFRCQGEVLFDPGQPQAQDFFKSGRPRIVGCFPDDRHNAQHRRVISLGVSAGGSGNAWLGRQAQFADGVFSVIAADPAEFIEDAAL
jgi:hypothetical protein